MVHLGIIPDGNRRWCKINNNNLDDLPIIWKNYIINTIKNLFKLDINKYKELLDITEISIYILSIDNINRIDKTKFILLELFEEINNIVNNVDKYFDKSIIERMNIYLKDVGLNIIGDINILPQNMIEIIEKYKKILIGKKYIINLAVAYDYNKDIINETKQDNLNYNREQSNIDLVFRSGGEYRLSGFFPTKIIYSELFFLKKLWLDVNINDIYNILLEYNKRERRFGR